MSHYDSDAASEESVRLELPRAPDIRKDVRDYGGSLQRFILLQSSKPYVYYSVWSPLTG